MAVVEVVRGMSTSMSCSSRWLRACHRLRAGAVRTAALRPWLTLRRLSREDVAKRMVGANCGSGVLMTAELVADLIGEQVWWGMSLRLMDAVRADSPDLVERPGRRRENGRFTARRRTRGTHTRREWGSSRGLLRGLGRWLEASEA